MAGESKLFTRLDSSSLEQQPEFRVDNTCGLVIIHPDVLVTPTKIADSFSCSRKAVLSDRIRGGGASNEAAVMGNLKHQFIEVFMTLNVKCAVYLIL